MSMAENARSSASETIQTRSLGEAKNAQRSSARHSRAAAKVQRACAPLSAGAGAVQKRDAAHRAADLSTCQHVRESVHAADNGAARHHAQSSLQLQLQRARARALGSSGSSVSHVRGKCGAHEDQSVTQRYRAARKRVPRHVAPPLNQWDSRRFSPRSSRPRAGTARTRTHTLAHVRSTEK